MTRLLIVDDDSNLLNGLRLTFRRLRKDWNVTTASGGAEALRMIGEQDFDLVLTDILMPDQEGIAVIRDLRRNKPELKVIAMSGGSRRYGIDILAMAQKLGACATLEKPFDDATLLAALEAASL